MSGYPWFLVTFVVQFFFRGILSLIILSKISIKLFYAVWGSAEFITESQQCNVECVIIELYCIRSALVPILMRYSPGLWEPNKPY